MNETLECPLCLGEGTLKRTEVLDRLGVKDFARVAQLSAEEAFRLLQNRHDHEHQQVWSPPFAPGEKQTAKSGDVVRASSLEPTPAFALSPDVAQSSLLQRVEPDYPRKARQRGIQGPVVLDLHIGKDGTVQDVSLVSGQAILAEAAISAVKQWRFKPHDIDGREVEMQTRITLRFTLLTP